MKIGEYRMCVESTVWSSYQSTWIQWQDVGTLYLASDTSHPFDDDVNWWWGNDSNLYNINTHKFVNRSNVEKKNKIDTKRYVKLQALHSFDWTTCFLSIDFSTFSIGWFFSSSFLFIYSSHTSDFFFLLSFPILYTIPAHAHSVWRPPQIYKRKKKMDVLYSIFFLFRLLGKKYMVKRRWPMASDRWLLPTDRFPPFNFCSASSFIKCT